MTSTTEFVWCMDTHNRDRNHHPLEADNPTNDVRIPVNLSINRVSVSSIELATLELPRAQRLVETAWSKIYIGHPVTFQAKMDAPLFNLQICDKFNQYTAEFPNTLNPVVAVEVESDSVLFRTRKRHLLGTHRQYWNWGEGVELLGLSSVVDLTDAQVVSETEFRVFGVDVSGVNLSASCLGFVWFPPLPSPNHVASVLEGELRRVFQELYPNLHCGSFRAWFDKEKGRLCICVSLNHTNVLRHAVLMVSNPGSAAGLLGFGVCNQAFARQTPPGTVCASCHPGTVSCIELTTGTYSAEELAAEMDFHGNRFYLETVPATATVSTDLSVALYKLQFGTNFGDVRTLSVPAGPYTPTSLASTLTALFQTAWPEGHIAVDWNPTDQVFAIRSENGTVFSLEFQTSSQTNVHSRLGFAAIRHTTEHQYVSDNAVSAAMFVDSQCNLYYPTSIWSTTVNRRASKFMFNLARAPPLPFVTTTLTTSDDRIEVCNPYAAHGFQVGDVVTLESVNEGIVTRLPVESVVSGTCFVLNACGLDITNPVYSLDTLTFTPVVDQTVELKDLEVTEASVNDTVLVTCNNVTFAGKVVQLNPLQIDFAPNTLSCIDTVLTTADTLRFPFSVHNNVAPKLNLLFSPKPQALKPSILGFYPQDVLWTGIDDNFQSPLVYRLQAASYILVQMIYPVGSARIEHNYLGDNKTDILGKIVILPFPWLERFYPMKSTFFSNIKLEYVHLRLLNPDHTLYQLHGHEWSATMRLNVFA